MLRGAMWRSLLLLALTLACQAGHASPSSTDDMGPVSGKADGPCEVIAAQQLVNSREHKMLLEPSLFPSQQVDVAVAAFADDIELAVQTELGRNVSGSLRELRRLRRIEFLDVRGSCDLRTAGLALRERVDMTPGRQPAREITLKARSSDRYIAAAADFETSQGEGKFEEDIAPPYRSVFSNSRSIEIGLNDAFDRYRDATGLFPGMGDMVADPGVEFEAVSGLQIEEHKYGEFEIDLGELDAEMSLTLWYTGDRTPISAEVSFKYETEGESFPVRSIERVMQLFDLLKALEPWRATESLTKTATVYSYDPQFCD